MDHQQRQHLAHMEASLRTVAPMVDKARIALYLLDQLRDQQLLLDVQMVECLPIAALMAEVVRTV